MDGGLGERRGGVMPGPGMFGAGPEAIIPHLSGVLPEVDCR